MVDGEKVEVSVDGKKMIRVKDGEITKGQVALITEQRLPLTVIDDFVVRPIGKKGQFSYELQASSEETSDFSLPSSNSQFAFCSLPFTTSRLGGPNAENDYNSFELYKPLNFLTLAPETLNPEPSPDPIYQTTSSLPPIETVYYYHHDHLGNIRVVTDKDKNVVERHDFYPFGEEITTQLQTSDQYLFTGKQRDSETGLDYFGARYYSSNLSRWMSPDIIKNLKATIQNPQKWNLYVYVLNNPIKFLDPEGNEEKISYFIVVDPSPTVSAERFFNNLREWYIDIANAKQFVELKSYLRENATYTNFIKEAENSSAIAFLGHSIREGGLRTGLKFSETDLKASIKNEAKIVFIAACESGCKNSVIPSLFGINENTKGSALVGFAGSPKTGYMAEALREFSKLILQGYSVKDAVDQTNKYLQKKINELNKAVGRQQYQFIPLTIIGDKDVKLQ